MLGYHLTEEPVLPKGRPFWVLEEQRLGGVERSEEARPVHDDPLDRRH